MNIQRCKSKSGFLSNNDCRRMRGTESRQRLRQRDKSIDISLYSGWDELTVRVHASMIWSIGKSPFCSPRGEGERKKLRKS